MGKRNKSVSVDRLQRALEKIDELEQIQRGSSDFDKWKRNTKLAISYTFGEESRHVREFLVIKYVSTVAASRTTIRNSQSAYLRGLKSVRTLLESMIEEINEYWPDDRKGGAPKSDGTTALAAPRDVFVVHGRDDGTRDTVARFLQRIEFRPIILNEQPSQSRTIIEKFERHVHAAFAIALLTPDDVGALASEKDNLKRRARQNVIFEFGYFMGRLGRERVCAIIGDGVEIPSDYDGVVYINLDDRGAWKMELVRELRAAGLAVDANRVL